MTIEHLHASTNNELEDIKSNNITKAHAIGMLLHSHFEDGASLNDRIIQNAIWVMTDLLGDAEEADNKIAENDLKYREASERREESTQQSHIKEA